LFPTTSPSGNTQAGYTLVLANKNAGSIVGQGLAAGSGTIPVFLGDEITTTAAVERGLTFTFIPNPNITQTIKTTITVYGNETGGSQSIPVTINYIQPR
jgi:archaellum component FlaG (FlaF/FlaG flagellin family)